MSPDQEALLEVVRGLERLSIPYMVTGSFASSFHGRPRSTHDADIVIDPSAEQLRALVGQLVEAEFYVDADRAQDALARRLQFNAIEGRTNFKIDLIIRKDRPFSREELARRQRVELTPGLSVTLSTAEDTILSKLEWSKSGGRSEKQLSDAADVLAVNPEVDRVYIERWANALGVLDLWREMAGG